ncbi:MAG: hypothetical protein WCG19_02915 [Chlorobiaceae bacterium]
METASKKPVIFFIALAITAFLTNFCWESLNGLLYKAHPEMRASDYVPMMLLMAAMDTLCIMGLYCITALLARRWFWPLGLYNSLCFFLSGVVSAYAVEYVSIFILHLWQYGPSMPILFGAGLFPLLQFSVTGLLSVFVARQVAEEEG